MQDCPNAVSIRSLEQRGLEQSDQTRYSNACRGAPLIPDLKKKRGGMKKRTCHVLSCKASNIYITELGSQPALLVTSTDLPKIPKHSSHPYKAKTSDDLCMTEAA
jgi:hypothetical protein